MSHDRSNSNLGSLVSVVRGASLFIIGKILYNILEFLFHLLLSRLLGSELYGIIAYAQTILISVLTFTNIGSNMSILKYIPEYEDRTTKQEFIYSLAWITSIGGGMIFASLIFIFSPALSTLTLNKPIFSDILRVFSLIVFFDTLSRIIYSTFRGLELLEYEILAQKIFKPIIRIIAVIFAMALGFSIYAIAILLAIASLLVFLFSIYLFITKIDLRPGMPSNGSPYGTIREYYNYSIPLTFKEAGNILISRVDMLMVGFFLSSSVVGVYNISLIIAGVIILPISAFNQLLPPVISRLNAKRNLDELSIVYGVVTRWVFTVCLLLTIGIIIFRYEILIIFGEDFTIGAIILMVLALGQFFNAAAGPTGYLLMMTGHQYVLLLNQWAFGISNIVLNYILILRFGAIGAALASASVLFLLNLVKIFEVWYLEGLFPYDLSFLKPIGAGGITIAILLLVQYLLPNIPAMIIGGITGTVSFALSLYLLGLNEEDRRFYSEHISPKVRNLQS